MYRRLNKYFLEVHIVFSKKNLAGFAPKTNDTSRNFNLQQTMDNYIWY